jgi:hypothetical protein
MAPGIQLASLLWAQAGVSGEGDDKGARSAALSAENARRDHRTLAPWPGPLVRQWREGAIPAAASESAQANSAGLANGIQSDDGVYSWIRAATPLD